MLTHCLNSSRDLFCANRRRFAKFAKIRSSRKFSRLQYLFLSDVYKHFFFNFTLNVMFSFFFCDEG
ncbi:MAG: hypothetical protein PV344_04110 [Anaplasma sp.]|nr:hypothetical protein [Anaplasma sp.]